MRKAYSSHTNDMLGSHRNMKFKPLPCFQSRLNMLYYHILRILFHTICRITPDCSDVLSEDKYTFATLYHNGDTISITYQKSRKHKAIIFPPAGNRCEKSITSLLRYNSFRML